MLQNFTRISCKSSVLNVLVSYIIFFILQADTSSRVSINNSAFAKARDIIDNKKMLNTGSIKNSKKVVVIGGGNFGTAIANRLAHNMIENTKLKDIYNPNITLWIYEEKYDGRNLSEVIIEKQENVKYLPGIPLASSIIIKTNITEVITDADIIFIVIPHQFIETILKTFPVLKSTAIVISLIKGIKITPSGPQLISDIIEDILHTTNIAVVMGANIASEVAHNHTVESTVASNTPSIANEIATLLYSSKCFHTRTCHDMVTVELCGALKNVVAMGAGFCDGMGLGHSSKALILRQGLYEMKLFSQLIHLYRHKVYIYQASIMDKKDKILTHADQFQVETLLESCGFPDLVASSYGGRNRLCAMTFMKHRLQDIHMNDNSTTNATNNITTNTDTDTIYSIDLKSPSDLSEESHHDTSSYLKEHYLSIWKDIERELLHGQCMQGLDTCIEAIEFLEHYQELEDKLMRMMKSTCNITTAVSTNAINTTTTTTQNEDEVGQLSLEGEIYEIQNDIDDQTNTYDEIADTNKAKVSNKSNDDDDIGVDNNDDDSEDDYEILVNMQNTNLSTNIKNDNNSNNNSNNNSDNNSNNNSDNNSNNNSNNNNNNNNNNEKITTDEVHEKTIEDSTCAVTTTMTTNSTTTSRLTTLTMSDKSSLDPDSASADLVGTPKNMRERFPLFYKIYDIALQGHAPDTLFQWNT